MRTFEEIVAYAKDRSTKEIAEELLPSVRAKYLPLYEKEKKMAEGGETKGMFIRYQGYYEVLRINDTLDNVIDMLVDKKKDILYRYPEATDFHVTCVDEGKTIVMWKSYSIVGEDVAEKIMEREALAVAYDLIHRPQREEARVRYQSLIENM